MAVQPVLGTTQQAQRERAREQTALVQTAISAFPVAILLLRYDSKSIASNQQRTQTPPLHVFLPTLMLAIIYLMVTGAAGSNAGSSRNAMSMYSNRHTSGSDSRQFDL
jgi:hypothetical protein